MKKRVNQGFRGGGEVGCPHVAEITQMKEGAEVRLEGMEEV